MTRDLLVEVVESSKAKIAGTAMIRLVSDLGSVWAEGNLLFFSWALVARMQHLRRSIFLDCPK